jgi:hypothetical protein
LKAGPASHDRALPALLVGVLAIGVLTMPALRYDGDASAWEMEAESLVERGSLSVSPAIAELVDAGAPYFVFNPATGNWHSKYGIGNTLVYAIPLLFEHFVLRVAEPTPSHGIFGKQGAGVYRNDRRLLLLNGFNILLSLLLALALYRLASLYTEVAAFRVGFVLICFYSTYLWNYLRAQSSQIYQCLFFTAALLFLLRFERRISNRTSEAPLSLGESRDLLWSMLALTALCLVKTVYLPLLGIFALAAVMAGWQSGRPVIRQGVPALTKNLRVFCVHALLPIACMVAILLGSNDLKFGGPFVFGYGREASLWGADLGESVPGYLFHPRYSVFVHFPLLVIALFGLGTYWRRHRFDLVVVWSCFLTMFAINSSYTFWKGEACVGPRYLLFALPALSISAIYAFEWIADRRRWLEKTVPTIVIAGVLSASMLAQLQINALEFHTFFRWRLLFESNAQTDPEVFEYFRNTRTARVNAEFIDYGRGGAAPLPVQRLEARLRRHEFQRIDELARAHLDNGNYYFW